MTAVITRVGETVDAIDLFCGFGGSSQGIHAAGADVIVAANHNQLALDCHAANFPDTDHLRADLQDEDAADYRDPASLPPARFLWASPSCKFHSLANAKKLYEQGPQTQLFGDGEPFDHVQYAASERSRVTMLCPLRYASRHRPEIVVVENVVEAAKWGPARDGSTFRWWLREWESLGYEHRVLFLNSMFFPPCPQSRDRMYVVLWRRGNTPPDLDYRPRAACTSDRCQGAHVDAVQSWKPRSAAWPIEQWGKYRDQYVYRCPTCKAAVEPVAWPAYSAIDWTNLGVALGDRASLGMKPLADTTLERIRRGMQKFRNGPPVIIPAKATWGGRDRPVTEPMSTQTSQQEKGLAIDAAFVTNVANSSSDPKYGASRARGLFDHLSTVTGSPGAAFVVKANGSIDEAGYRSKSVADPLGAITAHPAQQLASTGVVVPVGGNDHERPGQTRARSIDDPMFTLTATQGWGFAHQPFVSELRGGGSNERTVVDPLATLAASGTHHGLTLPALFQKINGAPGDTVWHDTSDPLNTITSRDTTGLIVLPWLDQYMSEPAAITDQLATVLTHARHALASIEVDQRPVTDDDLDAIRFRMLEPDPELRRAMAFGRTYVLLGNKSQKTAGLGNAVTPTVASWITERCLATLGAAA